MSRSSSDFQVPAGPAAGLCKGKGWAAGRPPARWAFSLAISMASAATRGDPAENAERQAMHGLAMHGYHENKDAYTVADYVAYIGAMKAVAGAAVMPAAPAAAELAPLETRQPNDAATDASDVDLDDDSSGTEPQPCNICHRVNLCHRV